MHTKAGVQRYQTHLLTTLSRQLTAGTRYAKCEQLSSWLHDHAASQLPETC